MGFKAQYCEMEILLDPANLGSRWNYFRVFMLH